MNDFLFSQFYGSIPPVFDASKKVVFYATDDSYAPVCGISIYSLIKNNFMEYLDIVVLSFDVSDNNTLMLKRLSNNIENVSVRIIDAKTLNLESIIDDVSTWTINDISTALCLSFLFENYDVVIKLHCYTIVDKHIDILFQEQLSEHYMNFDIIALRSVFDSDDPVICFNRNSLTSTNEFVSLKESLIQYIVENYTYTSFIDEDLCCKFTDEPLDYTQSIDKFHLYHFQGRERPWIKPNANFSFVFFEYARQTVWYELFIQLIARKSLNKVVITNAIISNSKVRNSDIFNSKIYKTAVSVKGIAYGYLKKMAFKVFPPKTIRHVALKSIKSKSIRAQFKYTLKKSTLLLTMPLLSLNPTSHIYNYKKKLKKYKDIHKGERCFIIGLGPSLSVEDLNLLKNEFTFSLNGVFNLFDKTDWRPTYYVWQDIAVQHGDKIMDEYLTNLPKHSLGATFFPFCERSKVLAEFFPDTVFYPIEVSWCMLTQNPSKLKFSLDCSKEVNAAYTTIYTIFQFANYMGFSEIYLLGTDCDYTAESRHCYPEEVYDFMKKKDYLKESNSLIKGFECADKYIKKYNLNMKVFNCTRGGNLEVFPRKKFEAVLEGKK